MADMSRSEQLPKSIWHMDRLGLHYHLAKLGGRQDPDDALR